jgi:hypothetical protein
MTFAQIDDYLKAYGVNLKKPTSGANSKYVYSRELLSDESESLIISIADELEIPHPHTATDSGATVVANFWLPLHFRLFLSHLSSFKKTTVQLQQMLRPYGISAFVAHVDIEPTKEWQDEIEASLISMDALAAILMPGFKESNWTDQEIGAAIGRGILVVPVIRGLDPYGFISRLQGISTKDKSVAEVAASIYKALMTSPKTRNKMVACLVETTLGAQTSDEAISKLGLLLAVKDLNKSYVEKIRDGSGASTALSATETAPKLRELLAKHGLQPVARMMPPDDFADDDIPF